MEQGLHGRRVSSFEVDNCDFLYFATTINDQIFLIPLQHWEVRGGYDEHHGECRQNRCAQGHWECVLVECHGTVEEEIEQNALNFELCGGNLSAGQMSFGCWKTLLEGGEQYHIQGQLGSILDLYARQFVFLAKPLATHPSTWDL